MQDVPKIVLERLKATAPVVNHPDADALTAFAEQSLPASERSTVLEHLARCSDCREVIALALPPTEEVTAAATLPVRSGWLTWPVLRWGLVAAAIVIIASLGILQYQRSAAPSIAAYKTSESAIREQRTQSAAAPAPAAPTAQPAEKSATGEPARFSADSLNNTTAIVMESKSASRRAVGQSTSRVGGTMGGIAQGTQLSHGPKMPAQWQQNNNNLQLQSSNNFPSAPSPAPQNVAPSASAGVSSSSPTATLEVNGEAPVANTQAANQEAQLQGDSSESSATSYHGSLSKAKPAEPVSVTVISAGPGQIGGYVVDPTGAAVPNARITITPTGTGATTTAVTNSQGAWLIAGLPTGNYKAQAEAPGFRTTVADLNYDAGRPSTYRFTLNVGSVSETVAVSAQDAQLSADTANTVASREISQLPLHGRDVTDLTSLSPGVTNSPRWTITSAGALQRSLDQGHTWQTVDVNASSAAASSLRVAANQSVASQTIANQSVAKQKDKGTDRKVLNKQTSVPSFRAVAASGAEVWAGGSGGALYHSVDAGNSWVGVQPSARGTILTGDIVSLDFSDSQHGKITTSTPEVWTTSDAGQTWQKQ